MTNKVWFQTAIAILLTIFIIKFTLEIQFIFTPFMIIIKTIILPVIFGGALFYLVAPIQSKLEEKKLARWASILIILVGILILLAIIVILIAPKITEEINKLIDHSPLFVEQLNEWRLYFMNNVDHLPEQVKQAIESGLSTIESSAGKIGSSIMSFIQSVTSALISIILIPFFFIFMLKDHEKFAPNVYKWFSGDLRTWLKQTLTDIDEVLRSYIQGQMIISSILATLLFIGYYLIGLEYALLLAIFALFMNVIPFLGPWIAFIPAVIIALIQDPMMILWVSLITLAAQQADSQIITPSVMGKSLAIHPLTIITLLLAAGSIAGFFGILLAIPTYAVMKVIIGNLYAYRRMIKQALTKDLGK